MTARMWRLAGVVAFVAIVLLLPVVLKSAFGSGYPNAANVLILFAIGATAALGLNIIVGYCGLLNLGFAGFMLIGAYTTGILMKEYHFSFWLALVVSVAHAAFWGIVLGIPTLRLTGDYFAIVTFGFSELVVMVAKNWVAITRGPMGYPGVPRPAIDFNWLHHLGLFTSTDLRYQLIITDRTTYWFIAAALLGITMLATDRLSRSRLGRAWRALREDEVAAEACGINAMWYKTIAFAISAGIGGMAGAMQVAYFGMVDFRYFEFMTSVFVLCYIVLGGMGTVIGPVVGAAVLVSLAELLRENPLRRLAKVLDWWPQAAEWLYHMPWAASMRFIIYGLILIIMIRFRPEGIFPSRSRSRELRDNEGGDEREASLFDLKRSGTQQPLV